MKDTKSWLKFSEQVFFQDRIIEEIDRSDIAEIVVKLYFREKTGEDLRLALRKLKKNFPDSGRLFFYDELDIYYLVAKRSIVAESNGKSNSYTVTLTFYTDGVAYSAVKKLVTAESIDGPVTTIKLENSGTLVAKPKITLTPQSENGYFSLDLNGKVFELGNITETDTKEAVASTVTRFAGSADDLVAGRTTGASANAPEYFYESENDTSRNDWSSQPYNGKLVARDGKVVSNGTAGNNAITESTAMIRGYGSNYLSMSFKAFFEAGAPNQQGWIKIYFYRWNRVFQYGLEIFKDSNENIAHMTFLNKETRKTDGSYYRSEESSHTYERRHYEAFIPDGTTKNPFRWSTGGTVSIYRNDDVVAFDFGKGYQKIQLPFLKGDPTEKIYIIMSNFQNQTPFQGISDLKLYASNVPYVYDVRNSFQKNDKIELDFSGTRITATNNGRNINNSITLLSRALFLERGENTLTVTSSNWASKSPTVEIEYNERYD